MKHLFSLEEIDLQTPDHADEVGEDVLTEILESGVEDPSGMFDTVGRQIEVIRQVSDIQDCVSDAGALRGVDQNIANIAQLAVEQLCASISVDYNRVTFKPQESGLARKENSAVALESFSQAARGILAKIVEMIRRCVAWVKAGWARRFGANAVIAKKIERLEDLAEASKASKAETVKQAPTAIEPKSFHNPVLARRLSVGGTVPQNVELVRAANDHFALMRRFYTAAVPYSEEIMNNLVQCEKLIYKDGSEFNLAVSATLGKIMSVSIINRACKNPPRQFPKGVTLYEEPMIFGGKSYFRSSANSIADITLEDIYAAVDASTQVVNIDEDQRLYPLEEVHLSPLATNIAAHARLMNYYADAFEAVVNRADTLAEVLARLDRNPSAKSADVDRSTRRSRQLARAFSSFTKQYNSIATQLYEYDQRVCNALLDYTLMYSE